MNTNSAPSVSSTAIAMHGVDEHGAIQVAIESIHARPRLANYQIEPERQDAAMCTHHTPIAGGRSPFSTQTLAADSRFE